MFRKYNHFPHSSYLDDRDEVPPALAQDILSGVHVRVYCDLLDAPLILIISSVIVILRQNPGLETKLLLQVFIEIGAIVSMKLESIKLN